MLNQLIDLLLLTLASILVMILHELPKGIYYFNTYEQDKPGYKKNVFALYQYIDPIGLILCITQKVGFSKPYMYRISDKETNKTLGIIGFSSLLCTFFLSMLLLNILGINSMDVGNLDASPVFKLIVTFILDVGIISLGMFLVNLFPMATFDMGLIIASQSSDTYYAIIKNDFFIKTILIIFILFDFFTNITSLIINIFLFT